MKKLLFLSLVLLLGLWSMGFQSAAEKVDHSIFDIDESLEISSEAINNINQNLLLSLQGQAEFGQIAQQMQQATRQLQVSLGQLRDEVIAAAGGETTSYDEDKYNYNYYYEEEAEKRPRPSNPADKETPKKLLVEGKQGADLYKNLQDSRKEISRILQGLVGKKEMDERTVKQLDRSLAFKVDEKSWEKAMAKNWQSYTFGGTNVAEVVLMLRVMHHDLDVSLNTVLKSLKEKAGGESAKSSLPTGILCVKNNDCLRLGDTFQATFVLGKKTSGKYLNLTVDDQNLEVVDDAYGLFETKASSPGRVTYKVSATVTNDYTGEEDFFMQEFEYSAQGNN